MFLSFFMGLQCHIELCFRSALMNYLLNSVTRMFLFLAKKLCSIEAFLG